MSSQAQAASNRENAQASTGPVTDAGKSASSQNAPTHGLSSGFSILADEDPDNFESLVERIIIEMQPSTEHEGLLVGFMAQARWKLGRIQNIEADLLDRCIAGEPVSAQLALIMRYAAAAERSYYKAHAEFMKSRSQQTNHEQAELNRAIENYVNAPPGQAKAATLKFTQPVQTPEFKTAAPDLASFRKTGNTDKASGKDPG